MARRVDLSQRTGPTARRSASRAAAVAPAGHAAHAADLPAVRVNKAPT